MRNILFFFLLILGHESQAQWKDFIISVRGDTLNRIDQQNRKQGPWVIRAEALRGEPGYDEQGYFVDDKKDGPWKRFSLMGDKIAEENYRWGALDGKARYYNRAGGLIREETWRAVDPKKTMDTVDVVDIDDPSKVVDRVIVKLEGQTMKHGEWTYYDPEWGTIQKTETYWMDKLRTGNGVPGADSELLPIDVSITYTPKTDSLGNKAVTKPKAIQEYEKKNSGKKKIKARDGSTGY